MPSDHQGLIQPPGLFPRRILGQRCTLFQCRHFLGAIKADGARLSKNAVSFSSALHKASSVVAVRVHDPERRPAESTAETRPNSIRLC